MTRRTSVALLALLLATVSLLCAQVVVASDSAIGAKGRPEACPSAYARPSRAYESAVAAATLCLVDRERHRHGLGPLRPNGDLDAIAAKQASDMVAGGYFSDNSRSGQTVFERIAASPYGWRTHALATGQNIAWGTGRYATPGAVVASWMRSAAHRQIILTGRYRDAGVGVVPASPNHRRGGATYVLELAGRSG